MPSQKRARKREGRRAREEYVRSRQRRAQVRKRVVAGVVVLALVAGVAFLFSRGDEGERVTAGREGTTTTTAATATTAVASDPEYGTTPCPAVDGSSPRTTRFPAPFAKCIDTAKTYTATFETDVGTFTVRLDPKRAPLTVNNFVALARFHAYDGVAFHRVIPDFVVQGGDVERGDGRGGPGYTIKDELPAPGDYGEGSLAMANSGPNTNGSQFFVVVSDAGARALVQAVGGQARYSLFGRVTSGMDVVKRIERDGSPSGTPKTVHRMVKVTISESQSES